MRQASDDEKRGPTRQIRSARRQRQQPPATVGDRQYFSTNHGSPKSRFHRAGAAAKSLRNPLGRAVVYCPATMYVRCRIARGQSPAGPARRLLKWHHLALEVERADAAQNWLQWRVCVRPALRSEEQ